MGVTVFYKGKLRSPRLVAPLIEELEQLADEMGWESDPFSDNEFEVNGILLQVHPKAEGLRFFFNANGELVNLLDLISEKETGKSIAEEFNVEGVDTRHLLFCKTQFAGPAAHKMVVELLVYLQKKYFATLEITDDGGYYPNKDEAELVRRMQFLDSMIDGLSSLLEGGDLPTDLPETQKEHLRETHRQLMKLIRFLGRNPYLDEMN